MTAPAATLKLNDAQRAALDLGRDLLVSAGAGAGKTQVLGLRYLAALETGRARVGEILAFTFTEKAAAEMRQRVQKLLLERLNELRAGPALANLLRARAEFANNRISTVHAFCKRLLSEYAWEAGLEPNAPVLDERDQRMARDAAIRRVLLQVSEDDPLAPVLERLSASTRLYSLNWMLHRAIQQRHSLGEALREAARAWADPEAEVARRKQAWEEWQAAALAPVLAELGKLDMRAANAAGGAD
jgi:ATP-dependent exoDNAse (exonuclease V) beta subunit